MLRLFSFLYIDPLTFSVITNLLPNQFYTRDYGHADSKGQFFVSIRKIFVLSVQRNIKIWTGKIRMQDQENAT